MSNWILGERVLVWTSKKGNIAERYQDLFFMDKICILPEGENHATQQIDVSWLKKFCWSLKKNLVQRRQLVSQRKESQRIVNKLEITMWPNKILAKKLKEFQQVFALWDAMAIKQVIFYQCNFYVLVLLQKRTYSKKYFHISWRFPIQIHNQLLFVSISNKFITKVLYK